MTVDEIKIARALRQVNIRFATKTKGIVLTIALQAVTHPDKDLTANQRRAMLNIVEQYRRQLPEEIVELAKQLKGEVVK